MPLVRLPNGNILKYIIDMDGFVVSDCPERSFLCKELGVVDLERRLGFLFRFRLHRTKKSLKKLGPINKKGKRVGSDRTSCWWNQQFKHGLEFKDYRGDFNQRSLDTIVGDLVNHCNANGLTIGYKGGTYESNLLDRLECNSHYDIAKLGCPKFDEFTINKGNTGGYSIGRIGEYFRFRIEDSRRRNSYYTTSCDLCTRHTRMDEGFHCPLIEVAVFGMWIIDNVLDLYNPVPSPQERDPSLRNLTPPSTPSFYLLHDTSNLQSTHYSTPSQSCSPSCSSSSSPGSTTSPNLSYSSDPVPSTNSSFDSSSSLPCSSSDRPPTPNVSIEDLPSSLPTSSSASAPRSRIEVVNNRSTKFRSYDSDDSDDEWYDYYCDTLMNSE